MVLALALLLTLIAPSKSLIPSSPRSARTHADRKAEVDSQSSNSKDDSTAQSSADKFLQANAWLQLKPSISPDKPSEIKLNRITTSIPNIKAWQVMDIQELPQEIIAPPSLLNYLISNLTLSDSHQKQVSTLWQHIKRHGSLRHLKTEDTVVIDALRVAYVGLWGKGTRRSVEDAIKRVRGIAEVLAELEVIVEKEVMSAFVQVILAGILHDVILEYVTSNKDQVEASLYRESLVASFGEEVISLGEKYNRLPTFSAKRKIYSIDQGELFLEMLITYVEDYRVLYIRLAERVHTMRQLAELATVVTPSESELHNKMKIAIEARHVYAPLAHKMNTIKFRGELEDIAFKILEPESFKRCKQTHFQADKSYTDADEDMTAMMRGDTFLSSQQITYEIKSRVKDKYQLHLKMHALNLTSPGEVRDAIGFRVVLNVPRCPLEEEETYKERCHAACYYVIEKVRSLPRWVPAENGFKDYIKGTKANGYQSLHQYMRHKDLKIYVELQVRTNEMHRNAELGEAAHWYYKDTRYRPKLAATKYYTIAWRSPQQLVAKSSAEFVSCAKRQILAERTLFYLDDLTTIVNVEKGCTALDGAFAVHSGIGLSARRILVHGKEVGFNYILRHGDVLTVETTEDKIPCASTSWLPLIKSTSAIDALRRYVNKNARNMNVALGCLKLLNCLALSADHVAERFASEGKLYPTAKDLVALVKKNTPYSNIGELLMHLGASGDSKHVAAELGRLLGMDPGLFMIVPQDWALQWARSQEAHGWLDKSMRNDILLPLLNEILPGNSFLLVRAKWVELIGPKSLTDQESIYFSALAKRMQSSKSKKSKMAVSEEVVIVADKPISPATAIDRSIFMDYDAIPKPSQTPWPSAPVAPATENLRLYRKSPYAIAANPYCLEAASLPPPLMRSAKKQYAERAMSANQSYIYYY